MAMHVSTVRFGDDLWEALDREARREGVSVAQFVRDAALLRIATLAARRGEDDALASLAELAETARRRGRNDAAGGAVADPRRVAAVQATGRIGRVENPDLDRIAGVVRRVLDVPVAMVSLVDDNGQHVLSCPGLTGGAGESFPLSRSICRHAVERHAPLAIVDAREEPLLADLVPTPGAEVVAYLGAPLVDADGHALGSLCAIDDHPRQWTRDQVDLMETLATSVVAELQRTAA
jgi:GAF domain-containing protein